MPLNLARLKPVELARILNSTPLGQVIDELQLRGHKRQAGDKIGEGRSIHFLRWLAWQVHQRHTSPATSPDAAPPTDPYQAHKERARQRQARIARSGRDIGPIPAVKDPESRAACERNAKQFLLSYFPHRFTLPFSPDHDRVIAKAEQAALEGRLFAMAMPRGSGKTTIVECIAIWAVLYHHRQFVVPIGSDAGHAEGMLESIKVELESNVLLGEDFPEVCYPIACIEGIANRCKGQLHNGQRTHIVWTKRTIVLPTIADSKASGAIIRVAGILGRIRGMKFTRPDGEIVRPDLVLPDDPQTDESAASLSQCTKRYGILAGAILGLAGPGKPIAGLMPCTPIAEGDMADRILDRTKNPEWQGEIIQAMKSFPVNEELWAQYAEIRADALRRDLGIGPATEFYLANRPAMDKGAVAYWPERYEPGEASAIQHYMNRKLRNERAFWAEDMCQPKPLKEKNVKVLTIEEVAQRFNNLKRGLVPVPATHLVAMIDVGVHMHFYKVLAVKDDFTSWIVDKGTYPEQTIPGFTKSSARPSLGDLFPGTDLEGRAWEGLSKLSDEILAKDWDREGGAKTRIELSLVDTQYGELTDLIYRFCRESKHRSVLMGSHGRYIGPGHAPMHQWPVREGERSGLNWKVSSAHGKHAFRSVVFDTNYWKSFVHERLRLLRGSKGSMSIFGVKPDYHWAEHITAEQPDTQASEKTGREAQVWTRIPGRDNDWLDTLVGCCVAASIQGASAIAVEPKPPRKKIRYSDVQRAKRI